jgi:hypothetical protein
LAFLITTSAPILPIAKIMDNYHVSMSQKNLLPSRHCILPDHKAVLCFGHDGRLSSKPSSLRARRVRALFKLARQTVPRGRSQGVEVGDLAGSSGQRGRTRETGHVGDVANLAHVINGIITLYLATSKNPESVSLHSVAAEIPVITLPTAPARRGLTPLCQPPVERTHCSPMLRGGREIQGIARPKPEPLMDGDYAAADTARL